MGIFDGEAIPAYSRLLRSVLRVSVFVGNMIAMSATRDFSSTLDWETSAKACRSIKRTLDMLVANCSMMEPIWLSIMVDGYVIIEAIAFVIAPCITWLMTAPTPCVRVVPSWATVCVGTAFMV